MATATKKQPENIKKAYDPTEIKVRRVNFQFSKENPRFYYKNNPISTHFINVLHIVFPTGERFFVNSVLKHQKEISEDKLKKQVRNFCGQEGIHAREHQRFWDVMEEQDLNPSWFANFLKVSAFSGKYSYENLSVKILNRIQPNLGYKFALSVTTALEHYTAILANALFHEPIATNDNIAPQMLELLHWHASEEIEHKSVCFDVLKEVDDSYILRVSGMGMASIMLWGYIGIGQIYFISKDKDKSIIKMPIESFILLRTIIFGEIGKNLSKHLLLYFKKDFHPNDIDDRYLIDKFFADKSYA